MTTVKVTIIGDINCDIMNDQTQPTKMLQSLCNHFNLSILKTPPTRITEHTETILDIIVTSDQNCFHNPKSTPFSGSDHHIVSCLYTPRGQKQHQPGNYIRTRCYKRLTREVAEQLASKDDLWQDILAFEDVETCVECFNIFIHELQNVLCPSKWRRIRTKNTPPWFLNPDIQNLRKLRIKAHKVAIYSKSHSSWEEYRHLRNYVTSKLRQAKANYLTSLAKTDQRKLWKHVSHIKGKKTT